MPTRGPVPLSFLYPLAVSAQVCPAESVTVNLSVPLDDSRTKATRRSPGLVVMGTENEVNAAPLTSMLFWTCTNAGPEPPAASPVPVRLAACGLPLALSATLNVALLVPLAVGVKVTLIVHWAPAATEVPQLLVCPKSPLFVPLMAMLVMSSAAVPLLERVTVCAALVVSTG